MGNSSSNQINNAFNTAGEKIKNDLNIDNGNASDALLKPHILFRSFILLISIDTGVIMVILYVK